MNRPTDTAPTFPALPATVKTYKSQRSATIAVNRADAAFDAAMSNRGTDAMHGPSSADRDALSNRVDAYIAEAWANLEATVKTAREQGFRGRSSWASYFERNASLRGE